MTVEINEADWFIAALLSNFTLNPFTLIVLNNNLKVLSKHLPNLKLYNEDATEYIVL